MTTTRVLLVEDHPVVLQGLRSLLTGQPDLEVVGEARTAAEAVKLTVSLGPDVVVLPVRLEGTHSGIDLCRSVKSVSAGRVVVFTAFTRTSDVRIALLAGADAVVSKTTDGDALLSVLRRVTDGGQALVLGAGNAAVQLVQRVPPGEPLTAREDEILALMSEGLTNPDIAARLTIGVTTVRTHVRSILRKLGVRSRRDLFRPAG